MADPLLPMTLGVGASLVKVLLQANGYVTAANLVGVAKEGCGILSWWKSQGGDADDQLAKQIAEILADKTRSMYEECRGQGIDKEQLGSVVTEVEILFNKVVENDELLLLAVENPASFSEVLQDDIRQRRKNIESRLEPYFDKLVKAAVDEYVELAPWSPKFQIEALKYISDKVCEILGISIEILENSIKSLENDKITHEKLDDLPNKIASVVKDRDYSQERVSGPDYFDTLTARNNLAGAYEDVGRFGEAIELLGRVLAEQERVLGPDHPDTLNVRDNLAVAYDSVGRLAEAIDAWEKLLPDCQRVLGLEHPLTKLVQKNLEAAKRKMNPPDAPSPETGED